MTMADRVMVSKKGGDALTFSPLQIRSAPIGVVMMAQQPACIRRPLRYPSAMPSASAERCRMACSSEAV